MLQKTCGATVGTCADAEPEKGDAIIVKEAKEVNLVDIDCSSFDIVKAVQYGALDRVKEIVEEGYNVNLPDNETVTLLHWAAINNRTEIVKFLLESNAIVDYKGGDLNSTPLHWATRQVSKSRVNL
jgi:palmitoyltransferase ZDHHC13/17